MKKFLFPILTLFISLSFFQCQKEINYNSSTVNDPATVSRTVQGNIVDETGQPAAGARVVVGTRSVITDNKGFFRIENAIVNKTAALVTAEKVGYFKSFRTMTPTSGAANVKIKLLKKELTGTIAASGGEVILANGAKVALPANAVVKAAGGNYTGDVAVYAHFIDPTADDIAESVPGSFMADDANNKRVLLSSYGMMAVELESASGEKLQIASGRTATLSMPIPNSIQSSAPASISLWYIDEKTGVWKEEGSAVKTGNMYIGQVNHFSFWNCDVSIPSVTLSLRVKDNHGIALVHVPVKITRTGNGFPSSSYGYTDSLGFVSGLVPSNEPLLLEITDPCNVTIFSQNINALTQSTDLGTLTIANVSSSIVTITADLVNCAGSPVTNGYAIIVYDNNSRYVNVNAAGHIAVSFTRCSNSSPMFSLTAVDKASQQQATSTNLAISTPITNLGTVTACGISAAEFLNYTIDGVNHSLSSTGQDDSLFAYTNTQGTLPYVTSLVGSKASANFHFSLQFSGAAAGNFPMQGLTVNANYQPVTLVQPAIITITNFPSITGQFYEGNFNGQFKDAPGTGPVRTISGSFRLRRS